MEALVAGMYLISLPLTFLTLLGEILGIYLHGGLVVSLAMLSIPYRTGRYGRNIPYRPVIWYAQPPCFVPEKIPAVPANFGQYRPVQKKVFFFFLSFVIFEFLLG